MNYNIFRSAALGVAGLAFATGVAAGPTNPALAQAVGAQPVAQVQQTQQTRTPSRLGPGDECAG